MNILDNDKFSICRNISWREDNFLGNKCIIIGMPQTHSIFFLKALERRLWLLCNKNKTFKEISTLISNLAKKDMKKECQNFIKKMIQKRIIQKL